jgi:hypothetical protein
MRDSHVPHPLRQAVKGVLVLAALLLAGPSCTDGFPLDGYPYTGIARLEGYRFVQEGAVRGARLTAGARLNMQEVDLRLLERPDLALPDQDPRFSGQVRRFLGSDAKRYGFAILDLTDLTDTRYAEHRGTAGSSPGSIGKLIVALGVFQALADLYPTDMEARRMVLKTAMITADQFIIKDSHDVPLWNGQTRRLTYRPLKRGDRASIWTYLDWMLSASSNAAASMVIKHLMLLVHYGAAYPVTDAEAAVFFRETPRTELSRLLKRVLQDPLSRNGMDVSQLRQGGFFTWKGKRLVPGTNSYAHPRALVQFLLHLEQGRLVDIFSSREIKRLLYMTERRIRYASHPALSDAAVYFKSGSLYRCREEADFTCEKYHGNMENRMNSVAIVESPARGRQLHYLVVVMSNVLRENSAVAHQTLAMRVHRLIEAYHRHKKSAPEASPAAPVGR